MKRDESPIARTELHWLKASGERSTICVEIGLPYDSTKGYWGTPVALYGLDGKLNDIFGEDSLQSLAIALSMVHSIFESIIESGDKLIDSEGDIFPLEAYFPKKT